MMANISGATTLSFSQPIPSGRVAADHQHGHKQNLQPDQHPEDPSEQAVDPSEKHGVHRLAQQPGDDVHAEGDRGEHEGEAGGETEPGIFEVGQQGQGGVLEMEAPEKTQAYGQEGRQLKDQPLPVAAKAQESDEPQGGPVEPMDAADHVVRLLLPRERFRLRPFIPEFVFVFRKSSRHESRRRSRFERSKPSPAKLLSHFLPDNVG